MTPTLTGTNTAMETLTAGSTRNNSDSPVIDCVERARVAVQNVVERVGYPHRGLTSRLAVVFRDFLTLKQNGVSETEARLIVIAADGVLSDLYQPVTSDIEVAIARHESDADRHEDAVTDLRLIEGDSAFLIEEHAKALETQAASSLALARALRAKARGIRSTQETARQRFGLAPNGGRAS